MLSVWLLSLAAVGATAQSDCLEPDDGQLNIDNRISGGAENFGLGLFRNITLSYPRNSVLMSPYSVWSVLVLAYYGTNGNTRQQLQNSLGLSPSKMTTLRTVNYLDRLLQSSEGTTLLKADKAYFANDIPLNSCTQRLLPSIEQVEFSNPSSAAQINKDVLDLTRGRIQNFLTHRIISKARFILINAVYFKGTWMKQFQKGKTAKADFYDDQKQKVLGTVDMMQVMDKFNYADSEAVKGSILELPYESSSISMYIILPLLGSSDVSAVIRNLDAVNLNQAIGEMRVREVAVAIPKFKLTIRIANELKAGIQSLGITDIFHASNADFSTFTPSERLFVDDSLHHATVEINEEGTVATAATGLVGTRSGTSRPAVFTADRPFIFLIRDKAQKLTLFACVVRNPKELESLP